MILHKTQKHNTVQFAVLVPDSIDRNGDVISSDEIVKTAHEFVQNLSKKTVNIDHKDGTDVSDAIFVELYVTPIDIAVDEKNIIKKGSWVVGIKFSDALYKQVLDGYITGISMEGYGVKETL